MGKIWTDLPDIPFNAYSENDSILMPVRTCECQTSRFSADDEYIQLSLLNAMVLDFSLRDGEMYEVQADWRVRFMSQKHCLLRLLGMCITLWFSICMTTKAQREYVMGVNYCNHPRQSKQERKKVAK